MVYSVYPVKAEWVDHEWHLTNFLIFWEILDCLRGADVGQ